MKRISILIVVVLLLSVTLIACTTATTPPNNEDKPSEGGQGNTESPKPPVNDGGSVAPSPEESVPPTPSVEYDKILIVTANTLNVRSSKGSDSKILGRLKKGSGVALMEDKNDGWYKIYYKNKMAYISKGYADIVSIPKSNDKRIERVIYEGKRLLGFPYIWGSQRYHWGNGILNPKFEMGKFDCSALTQYIFYKGANVLLDVTSRAQSLEGKPVEDKLRRGDLMFFTNKSRKNLTGINRVGHVALYLGDNYILHTASTYAQIESISSERWSNYLWARRFL